MNTCYKCEKPLDYDPKYTVHPLCDTCNDDFMDWLRNQIG